MRIFLIIPALGKGGAERVVSLLSKGLSQLGHEVYVLALFDDVIAYNIAGTLINLGLRYDANKVKLFFNMMRGAFGIRKCIKKYKPDKVFSFMEFANLCTLLVRKESAVSVRVALVNFSVYTKILSKYLYTRANKVIAVSSALAEDLRLQYHLKNVVAIKNPLDMRSIDEQKQMPIHIQKDFILSVGRLEKQKNHALLIKAYANLVRNYAEQVPDLLILGQGNERENLQTLINELGVSSKVELMGVANNPYAYMARARIFVLSSLYEGCPNVLLEAMACSALVISTDCPTGPNEIIEHGKNGFLVENNNVAALEKMLEHGLFFENNSKDIRELAKKSVTSFNLAKICKEYLKHAEI